MMAIPSLLLTHKSLGNFKTSEDLCSLLELYGSHNNRQGLNPVTPYSGVRVTGHKRNASAKIHINVG